ADALGGGVQLVGDLGDRPAGAGEVNDVPLAVTQHDAGGVLDRLAVVAQLPLWVGGRVGQLLAEGVELPAALRALLDRVDGPHQLAALVALGPQGVLPFGHLDPLEQAGEDLLGAVAPTVRGQAGVAPAGGAVARDVADRLRAGRGGAGGA